VLKSANGLDTVDELLCKFYNWKVVTDASLHVKHLKPTGANTIKARYKQGEHLHHTGHGLAIVIASAEISCNEKKIVFYRLHERF
jgi:hypothetical protein